MYAFAHRSFAYFGDSLSLCRLPQSSDMAWSPRLMGHHPDSLRYTLFTTRFEHTHIHTDSHVTTRDYWHLESESVSLSNGQELRTG